MVDKQEVIADWPLGTHQMLSLRSLAFILCSAIRRARTLSCATLHRFPDKISGRKRRRMAINNPKKMATNNTNKLATDAPMCSLLRNSVQVDRGARAKDPFETLCGDTAATGLRPFLALIFTIFSTARFNTAGGVP
jgi:hypothetical protein